MDSATARLEAALHGENPTLARRVLNEADSDSHDPLLGALAVAAATPGPDDQLAVELLVETVDRWGVARSAVRRFLLDESAVDDVTQDTLITLARSVSSFRGEAKFTTWLHQLARNRAVDHLRRLRATQSLDADGTLDEEPTPAARMSSLVASRQRVRELLEELPDQYRDAVVLRDVELLPYAEVADRLGRNLNTVKSHVARGRALLAALVERDSAA